MTTTDSLTPEQQYAIDNGLSVLVDSFTKADQLTELERINLELAMKNNITQVLDVQIGLNGEQQRRLDRICRDRNCDAGDFVANLLGSYLEANIGAPTINKPQLSHVSSENADGTPIKKVTGVSEQRLIRSVVDGVERV
jgi:hypothetical protein